MNRLYNALKNFWTRDKSFTFLLVVLVTYLFILIPFLIENLFSKITFLLFYYLLLTSSMPFLIKKNKKIIASFLFILPFIFLIIEIYYQSVWIQVITDLFVVLYCLMLGYIILIRTFEKGRINSLRVQGAVIVYLLAALVFCLIFHSLYILNTEKSFSGVAGSHRKEFLYLSLCALTTDSYGDILPLTSVARSLVNLESLVGVLYPAILIARLVSMESYYNNERRSES
jgi:hypothetical protein